MQATDLDAGYEFNEMLADGPTPIPRVRAAVRTFSNASYGLAARPADAKKFISTDCACYTKICLNNSNFCISVL